MNNWETILPVCLALLAFFFAWYRWMIARADKRHEAHDKKFAAHDTRFDRQSQRIDKNEKSLADTRDELHVNYVRHDQVLAFQKTMTDEFSKMHHRLSGIAKDVNKSIGAAEAARENEMAKIAEEITKAIKDQK